MLRKWLRAFHENESGATIVEYSVLLTLLVIASFQFMRLCGEEVAAFWQFSASELGSFL